MSKFLLLKYINAHFGVILKIQKYLANIFENSTNQHYDVFPAPTLTTNPTCISDMVQEVIKQTLTLTLIT
jgi:hypothetical protein